MNIFCIKKQNILPLILALCFIGLIFLFFILEISSPERIVLPILISSFISSGIYLVLRVTNKDSFVSKIYLISILIHFVFILFWQIIKYYLLGLPMPSDTNFSAFISDVDGVQYHFLSSYISDNYNINTLSQKYYGGLFPKIVGTLYLLFGKNPFIASCFNSLCAGFVSVLVYLISKNVLLTKEYCKIYALLCVFCTSFIVNTSLLMRDVYITLFIYLAIYLSYKFFKTKNILYLISTLLSIYLLYLFRPYAAIILVIGIIAGNIIRNIKFRKYKNNLRVNKWTLALIILLPFILFGVLYGLNFLITNSMLFIKELSVETLINVRETAYSVSNSTYSWNFLSLYNKFFLLPFIVGYLCLFFAPFPWEWIYVKRLHFVPDMLVLYCLLPSFLKNIKKVFTDRNYFLLVCFCTMIIMFSIYCITVGNSGTIHRLRGPYIPMIYLIAMYRPDKFLKRILSKLIKWRII